MAIRYLKIILVLVALGLIGGTASAIQYHPHGWDHDGLITPPGWMNVYDDDVRYEYVGDVIINTKDFDYAGSLYAEHSGAPWMIVDMHGMPIWTGGPRAPFPVGMQFTYYRYF